MTTHGGKRSGAGKKPLGDKPRLRVIQVRVTQDELVQLAAIAEELHETLSSYARKRLGLDVGKARLW